MRMRVLTPGASSAARLQYRGVDMSRIFRIFKRILGFNVSSSKDTRPAAVAVVSNSPEAVYLRPRINRQSMFVGLTSQGWLELTPNKNRDLRMRQHFTDLSNVVRFSNFNGDFFLVGEIAENNEVFGQENIRVQDQADFWYLRSAPRARSGEVFLQFYKEGCRDPNWVQKGKFFIIRFDAHRNPEFRLGDYNAAIEHGVFNIID